MGTYYVRTTGNDTTGDGSTGNPWATLHKALTTIDISGNHTVYMGDGTYQENSGGGYLYLNKIFTDWVTILPELGAAGSVTITGASHATYNTRIDQGSYLKFQNITFACRVSTNAYAIALIDRTFTNVVLEDCAIVVSSDSGGTRRGIYGSSSGDSTPIGLTLTRCTFSQTGEYLADALYIKPATVTTDTVPETDQITIQDCTVTITGKGLWLTHRNNVTITGCTIATTGESGFAIWTSGCQNIDVHDCVCSTAGENAVCVQIGDNGAGDLVSGTIYNITASSTQSHGMIIGGNAQSVTAANLTIIGGDQGLVFKSLDGPVTLTGGSVSGGSINCLYFKGAANCTLTALTVKNAAGNVLSVDNNGAGSPCSSLSVTACKFKASGSADLFAWGDADSDSGGSVCDYNRYKVAPGAAWGSVYGTAVASLAQVRAAWDTYDNPNNDNNSRPWRIPDTPALQIIELLSP